MVKLKQPFDFAEYGGEVLARLEAMKSEISRVRDQVDSMQPIAANVMVLSNQMSDLRETVKKLSLNIEAIAHEFQMCQLASSKAGGITKADMTKLEERLSTRSTVVSVISGVLAIVFIYVIKIISGK